MKKLFFCIFPLLLAACNLKHLAYERPFTQGNTFTKEDIEQLDVGMTSSQVRDILGNPVLTNVISRNEWDYVYYEHAKGHTRHLKTVILRFEEGKLVSISPM